MLSTSWLSPQRPRQQRWWAQWHSERQPKQSTTLTEAGSTYGVGSEFFSRIKSYSWDRKQGQFYEKGAGKAPNWNISVTLLIPLFNQCPHSTMPLASSPFLCPHGQYPAPGPGHAHAPESSPNTQGWQTTTGGPNPTCKWWMASAFLNGWGKNSKEDHFMA